MYTSHKYLEILANAKKIESLTIEVKTFGLRLDNVSKKKSTSIIISNYNFLTLYDSKPLVNLTASSTTRQL